MACNRKRKTLTVTDWSDLPQELVISIANRIVLMEDFTAFGAVCKSWRSAATKEIFTSRLTHQVPFLMFRKKDAVGMLEFYSLTRDKILKFKLPEGGVQIICSCLGWLFTSRRGLEELNLLHPLNHSQIKLPGFRDSSCQVLRCRDELSPFVRFVLSSSPSWTSDYTIIGQYDFQKLAFCKPREHKYWTSIVFEEYIWDIICYKGRFYAMDDDGIWVCDTENPKQAKANVVVPEIPFGFVRQYSFMAESAGD
ncbi:F-box protein [Prunus yedoensis var. nudiflora]|uniref:F-box protein n=1 Tax=Prunus yedoensis var. nudiflora TaxID=2094558 RepID=A0A314UAV3_PRUYE|nr:F-box protein [Prunus yedoensis var. nudiflora]